MGACEKVPSDKSFAEIIAFMIGCIIVKEQTIRGSVMSGEERKLGCHWQRFLSISFSLRNFTQEIIWDSGMRGAGGRWGPARGEARQTETTNYMSARTWERKTSFNGQFSEEKERVILRLTVKNLITKAYVVSKCI